MTENSLMTPHIPALRKFRVDVDVFEEIERLANSHPPSRIHDSLTRSGEYVGRVPSLRTVQRIVVYVLEDRTDDEKSSDEPFQWRLMGNHSLPWEAGPYLLRMWAFAEDGGVTPHISASENVLLAANTFRDAKWWWRIHLAVPDISLFDVHWLARKLASLERTNLQVPTEDIQAFLAYRPWMDDSSRMRYKQYIESNCIRPDTPPSRVVAQDFQSDDRLVAVLVEHTRFVVAKLHLGLVGEYGLLQTG